MRYHAVNSSEVWSNHLMGEYFTAKNFTFQCHVTIQNRDNELLRIFKSISGVYSINGNNINRVISEFIRHSLNVNFEPDFGSFGPIWEWLTPIFVESAMDYALKYIDVSHQGSSNSRNTILTPKSAPNIELQNPNTSWPVDPWFRVWLQNRLYFRIAYIWLEMEILARLEDLVENYHSVNWWRIYYPIWWIIPSSQTTKYRSSSSF